MEKTFKILGTVILLLLFTACATTKRKFVKLERTQIDSLRIQSNTDKQTTIHNAIKDTVFVSLHTGNTQIDSLIQRRFEHFKTAKKSGSNSYNMQYDMSAKGFQITSTIGATKDVTAIKNDSIFQKEKETFSKQEQEVKVKYRIPIGFWVFFLILTGVVYVGAKLKFF